MNFSKRLVVKFSAIRRRQKRGVAQDQASFPWQKKSEQAMQDYSIVQLSLQGHPVEFIRSQLDKPRIIMASGFRKVGKVSLWKSQGFLRWGRPSTAGGVCFMTIEDEAGFVNIVIFENCSIATDEKSLIHSL